MAQEPTLKQRIREMRKVDPGISPFDLTAGPEIETFAAETPPAPLFGPLWHEGELAVLFGPAAAGKSILAVQLADALARGVRTESGSDRPPLPQTDRPLLPQEPTPQNVLYIDFERTPAQFAERYSAPAATDGHPPVHHPFPQNFTRVYLEGLYDIPSRFKGDTYQYLIYWLSQTIDEQQPRVVIIDNISYLTRSLAQTAAAGRLMKTLKLWTARYQISLLAVAHSRPIARRRPLRLTDLAAAPPVAELADTVFAIHPSTLAPDLRYIKHLKSRNAPLLSEEGWNDLNSPPGLRRGADASSAGWSLTAAPHNEHNVLTTQITREAVLSPSPVSLSPVSLSPASPTPFLQVSPIALTPESIHLTDPFAQLSKPKPRIENPKSLSGTVNMLMSREHQRYLER